MDTATLYQHSLPHAPPPPPHSPTLPKKRKSPSTTNASDHSPSSSKKRLPSCDLCRARKVKCVKVVPGAERCEGCVVLDQNCEYTHERRKPGPANSYAKKTLSPPPQIHSNGYSQYPPPPPPPVTHHHHQQQQHSQSTLQQHPHPHDGHHRTYSSASTASHSAIPMYSPIIPPPQAHIPYYPPQQSIETYPPHVNTPTLDLPWLPISPNSLLHAPPGELDSSSEDSPLDWWTYGLADWTTTTTIAGPSTETLPDTSGNVNGNGTENGIGIGLIAPALEGERRVSIHPVLGKALRIEDVLPWSTLMKILQAYHAHLYPLMPIVHWPSFSQLLISREDERSETWRAFLLSLVAYSIIQLPRSALTFLPARDLRRLHQRCHASSRALQNRRYTDVTLVDVSCDHIYLGTLGRANAANIALVQAMHLAQVLKLHDERTIEGDADGIEREVRRRVFWLLYGSDRTITALGNTPLLISDVDLHIPLPLNIDDNLLTPSGSFPQPPTTTPVLAGFHFASRLFRLLGAVLSTHRSLPQVDTFQILNLPPEQPYIRPASQFMDELERILSDLPGPLQIANPSVSSGIPTTSSGSGLSDGMGLGTSGVRDKDTAAFATCRANLLVSQAMVRFAIRQYARSLGEREREEGEDGIDERAWAERDVLSLLEAMSSESLAANGESLRRKVLFVASSLLEKYPSSAEGHNYVSDFLAVYTRISEEQHATLLEVGESATPSRDHTPGRGEG